jgi:transcription initiation factor TFIID subunit 1
MSTSVTNIGIAMTYLNGIVSAARKRKNMMRKLAKAKTQRKSNHQELFTKAKDKLNAQFEQIEKKVQIANFIYEELQLTPWNLTTDFMDVHKTQGGTGTMKLTGIGDPSGVSAGFNFMRETDKPNKAAPKNDSKDKKEITGTNKDLRKLSMKEMARILLEEYGVKQKDIQTLARWDRVHMIRELSTKAASDNAGDGMERYARGEKIKLRDKIDSYRKRIQEIWERQRSFLKEIEEEPPLEKSETLSKEDKGMSKDDDDDDDDNDDDDNDDEDYV